MNSCDSQTQSRGTKTRRTQSAFTLIELLVVIAIIAILAAILFPVFQKVRENARRTACLSNEKQIGLGILQYNQDYDEKYIAGGNKYGRGSGWAGQLYPYVKSTAVFRCPDDSTNLPGTNVSYGLNAQFSPYNGAGTGSNGISLAQINSPAKTVLIFEVTNSGYYDITIPSGATSFANGCTTGCASDVDYYGGSAAGWGTGATESGGNVEMVGFNTAFMSKNSGSNVKYATGILRNSDNNGDGNFLIPPRHNDGSNYTMADGHTKFFRPSAVSAGFENSTPGNCGSAAIDGSTSGGLAATTTCSDSTIAATFNVAQ
jgi:prepilin-type N-terminal cleavage/methylation domain-containing protein/prepilin-type processing-associated H-X9-DG protein